jgi:uncharacterized protein (TIGR00251 family)
MAFLTVHVIPRAAKPGLAGTRGGALLLRLSSPPVDGAANAELIRILADALDVPRRSISIVSGESSRRKRIRVDGVTDEYVAARLKLHSAETDGR